MRVRVGNIIAFHNKEVWKSQTLPKFIEFEVLYIQPG